MKTKHFKFLGFVALSSLCSLISVAQSVSSTPVGYLTYTVNANSDLKLGIPMEQASSFSGSVASIAAGTIDAGSTVGDLTSSAHYVKLTSGALSGQWYQVTGASGSSITVAEDLAAAGVSADDTFQVTPFWTMDTLLASGGGVPGSPDIFNATALVLTFDPSAVGTNLSTAASYLYYTGSLAPEGWYDSSALTPAGSVVINPDTYIQIRNTTSSSVDVVVSGTVPSSGVALPVVSRSSQQQDNLVYNPYPTSITLGTSNLYESGAVAGSPDIFNPTDLVLVYPSNQSGLNSATSASYLYYTGSLAPEGWYDSSALSPAGDVAIEEGAPVIIRKAAGSDSTTTWSSDLPYSL